MPARNWNTVAMYSMDGELKWARLSLYVAKPPVPAIDIEKHTLSNSPMPATWKNSTQLAVMAKYTVHIHFASVLSRGCILVFIGPVDSAANTLMLPPTTDGSMAMVKNTMPKPPIQWVSDRQNSMVCGRHSTSSMMVAPVVVNPDMVSK